MSAVLVVDLIIGRAVCVDCIAHKTHLTIETVIATLISIHRTFEIRDEPAICDGCLTRAVVHRLG